MIGFYEVSDVLVISLKNDPSLSKYIPAKFQSYLTCGKPIFAAIYGEVKHLVKDYNLGWTADPDNLEDISGKFEDIYLSAADVLHNKGQSAKDLLKMQFNREKIIQKITSYILENNEK
jgi:glycosyltransferase involved in cell wall biosynthesis